MAATTAAHAAARTHNHSYAPPVKRLRAFLDRLPGGHRPPTGPLTTKEAADAEELRQETLATDEQRIEHERDEESDLPRGA